MKLQIAFKSFLLILPFLAVIMITFFFTNIYFDSNYSVSPTFDLIKWTGLNIILCHFIYIVTLISLLFYEGKFLGSNFYSKLITLILIIISLIFTIVYFYDFLQY